MRPVIKRAHSQVVHRADHVVETHEVRPPEHAENNSAEEGTNKALDCLFRGKFDERRTTKGNTPNVCKDIVADHQGCGDPEPYHTLKDVIDNEMAKKRVSNPH